jgi:peptidoglycan hydrolase-like protein with peptidoglycan-binding domain
MVELVEEEGPRVSPLSAAAVVLTLVLGGAIVWNALTQQPVLQAGYNDELPPGATAKLDVSPDETPGGTITLRFDQVTEDVQKALAASGFYNGPIDGVAGKRTKAAIMAFQQANGLDVTGAATPELAERILFTQQIAKAAGLTTSALPAAEEPDGKTIKVQKELSKLGYFAGDISGVMSEDTRAAIRAFERDRDLIETGEINDELLAALDSTAERQSPPAE